MEESKLKEIPDYELNRRRVITGITLATLILESLIFFSVKNQDLEVEKKPEYNISSIHKTPY